MTTQAELPRWKCHKVVHAAKILAAGRLESVDGFRLMLEGGYTADVSHTYVARAPTNIAGGGVAALLGGYYVVYEDGYVSWSPGAAFESGHSRL